MKKMIISILSALIGGGISAEFVGKVMSKDISNWRKMSDKHLELFLMMNQWVKVKQEGKNLAEYFEKNNIRTIAIYGMSYAGETLISELKGSGICVRYGIDNNAGRIYSSLDIVTMEGELKEVDAVVVTAITFFDEIREKLNEKLHCPIISLEDILYEI